jgi:N-acetylmuramoyl-L-alanine amidase
MARVTRITVHHTAEVAPMGERGDADVVRAIQRFHQDDRGWADVGYHWLVGRDGRIYEGRAVGVQGAHAGGERNVENLGIALVGDFTNELPSPVQLDLFATFLAEQRRLHGVPASEVLGHRDLAPTECPGSAFYAWFRANLV